MFERLEAILERYEKINEMMADPAIVTDIKKLTELSKEQRGLEETVNVYTEYKEIAASIEDLKEMAKEQGFSSLEDYAKSMNFETVEKMIEVYTNYKKQSIEKYKNY